jgi:hypothetical protein
MDSYSVSSIAPFCLALCLARHIDLANSKSSIYSSITDYTNSIEKNPSGEAICQAVSQEATYMELTDYYYDHKNPPLEPNLSYVNSVHTFISHLCKKHFNIIFPLMPTRIQRLEFLMSV